MMPDSVARANNGFHELAVPCTTVPPLPRIETRSRQPHKPTRFLLFPACCYPLLSIPCSLSLSPLSDMAFPRRASLPPSFSLPPSPFLPSLPTSPSRQTKPASFLHFLPSPFSSFYPLPLCFCTGEEKERLPPALLLPHTTKQEGSLRKWERTTGAAGPSSPSLVAERGPIFLLSLSSDLGMRVCHCVAGWLEYADDH